MTSKATLEPGTHDMLSKIASVQVKTTHSGELETITVEVQLSQNTWENLLRLFVTRKWVDDEGLAAVVAAGAAVLQTELAAVGADKTPDQTIQELRTQLADLEAQCEVLRNQVDKLHTLEWRDLPLAREELGDCQALVMRLRDERDALQTENAQLRRQSGETGESETHR